jgi:hypothetical protein
MMGTGCIWIRIIPIYDVARVRRDGFLRVDSRLVLRFSPRTTAVGPIGQ